MTEGENCFVCFCLVEGWVSFFFGWEGMCRIEEGMIFCWGGICKIQEGIIFCWGGMCKIEREIIFCWGGIIFLLKGDFLGGDHSSVEGGFFFNWGWIFFCWGFSKVEGRLIFSVLNGFLPTIYVGRRHSGPTYCVRRRHRGVTHLVTLAFPVCVCFSCLLETLPFSCVQWALQCTDHPFWKGYQSDVS